MRIALIGMGRMGRMIRDCAADRGIEVAAEFNTATIAQLAQCDRMDAVIDFSAPASLPALAAYVQRTGTPLVSGTTGYCDEEAARVNALGSYAARSGERQLLHRRCGLKAPRRRGCRSAAGL